MTPDTIPALIAWLAGVGAVALLIGALIIGPAVYRWRLRRIAKRIHAHALELPELADLLAQVPYRPARDPDPLGGELVRVVYPSDGPIPEQWRDAAAPCQTIDGIPIDPAVLAGVIRRPAP